ncbi:class F sortase [Kitasatospora sp. NPDC004531]
MSTNRHAPGRRPTALPAAAALAATALLGAGLLLHHALAPRQQAFPVEQLTGTDMTGRPVRLDPDPALPPEQQRGQDARPDGAGRFVVPSVGLDVPLGTMNEVGGSVVPPGFASAYRIANLGTPADPGGGTVYVAMHSLRRGATGPGNYLFALDTGASTVAPGAEIEVGGARYVVDGAAVVPIADLPDAADLWSDVPGRLVVLTCLERPDDTPAVDNFVLTAHLDR